jgi:hypothetical protein
MNGRRVSKPRDVQYTHHGYTRTRMAGKAHPRHSISYIDTVLVLKTTLEMGRLIL